MEYRSAVSTASMSKFSLPFVKMRKISTLAESFPDPKSYQFKSFPLF